MRIAVIWVGLFVCLLVLSEASDQDVVTVTEYIDIHENEFNHQHLNTLCDGVELASNVSNTMIALRNITEYGTHFHNTLGRIKRFLKTYNSLPSSSRSSLERSNSPFDSLNELTKIELLTAIKTLRSYRDNSQKVNARRRSLFKDIPFKQRKLCEEIGYLKKLSKIDSLIDANQNFLSSIAEIPIEKYKLADEDFDILTKENINKNSPSKANFRVVEALGHYVRDWSRESDQELKVILEFIKKQLEIIIPLEERTRTAIVIPGSGLGRISHEIAEIGKGSELRFRSVHAVEYSGIMHLCNNYIYSDDSNKKEQVHFPFIHSCSNHMNESSQFRPYHIYPKVTKPENLFLHHEDFRRFEIPSLIDYENVVVVSVFFIDTGANIMEYLDKIKLLTTSNIHKKIQKGYWINVGPLKYGSAPRIEFNLEEINKIKLKSGWEDINSVETTESQEFDDKFVGYMTDRQSLWQAFYSLCMWSSARIENFNN